MKVIKLLLILVLGVFSLQAETYEYPGDDPLFSISFPDDWSSEPDGEVLHASPSDNSIYLGLWALNDVENLEIALNELDNVVSDLVDEVEWDDESTEFEINDIQFLGIDGEGVDEDDNEINVSVGLFFADEDTVCIIIYFGSPEAEEEYEEDLNWILASIELQ